MNLKRILGVIAVSSVLFGGAAPNLTAQMQPIPHRSGEMLDVARQYAADNLPGDAVFVVIGAVGNTEPTPGVLLTINADSGTSSAWAYIYHIASQNRWTSIAVVDIPMIGPQIYEMAPPTEIPPTLTSTLRLDHPFGESGAMATRLMLNADYLDYREAYPSKRADLVSYSDPVADDSVALPNGFPLDAPLWIVQFSGSGAESMVCWVSGRTGESVCRRGPVASADDERTSHSDATVIPNPASGTATIMLPRGSDGSTAVELYDASGRRADGAVHLLSVDGAWRAVIDVSAVKPGIYVVSVDGVGAIARVVVAR